jgi:hypothetical protein
MKNLQPYWFLQEPIDAEHKYYILMDFLQSVETDLGKKKYSEQIQKITRVYRIGVGITLVSIDSHCIV